MNDDMAVLCLDVGSGTQDVLYRIGKERPANWPKFVLPSPAKRVDRTIRALTGRGAPLHLTGSNMGGGFFHALKAHLEAGLTVSAHPAAAKALFDDLSRLEAMGVELCSFCPAGHVPVHLADFDPGFWEVALAGLGLPRPDLVLAAARTTETIPASPTGVGASGSGRGCFWRQAGDPRP